MTTVVVNASPLIFLGKAGRLELLRALADEVLVPEQVFAEIAAGSQSGVDRAAASMAQIPWLVRVPGAAIPSSIAAWDLGEGEAAVLATALERGGLQVVVDDLAGRRCGRALGLPVSGTLGVVVAAARAGLISDAPAVVDELRRHGMWLSGDVVARVGALIAAALQRR